MHQKTKPLMPHKRGFFFTVDVMLCVIVLSVGFILVWSFLTGEPPKEQPYFLADDIATIMASTKNVDILDKIGIMVDNGTITNLEYTIFEQIADFYISGRIETATDYTRIFAQNLLPPQYSMAVLLQNVTIYNNTRTVPQEKASFVISSKRMVVVVANQTELLGPFVAEVRVW